MGCEGSFPSPEIPQLRRITVADPPARWEALGFEIRDGQLQLGEITLTLGGPGRGITAWSLTGIDETTEIDGLPTTTNHPPSNKTPVTHPNGALGIDHVVIATPDFERTSEALANVGMPLKRIRDAGSFRQGFRRIGPAILEIVEAKTAPPGPATFWGLVVIVDDLDALKRRLEDRLGDPKPAVQPGRHIATLRPDAGLTTNVAFMDEEP